MNTDLFCPTCATSEHITEERNIGFRTMNGEVLQGVLTTGIQGSTTTLNLTCSLCGHQYKNGDYQRRQIKLKAARLALNAMQNGNQLKAVTIYALLSLFISFIAYKFFFVNWVISGFIFSAAAFILFVIAVTGLIFTTKRK